MTGIGMLTPFGTGLDTTWDALVAGKTAIQRISRFDPSPYDCQVGAEVSAESASIGWDRPVAFARSAIDQALADATLPESPLTSNDRLGVVTTTHGTRLSLAHLREVIEQFGSESAELYEVQSIARVNRALATEYSRGGVALGLTTACSSGAMAVLEGCRLISSGRCDAVIVCGTDSVVNEMEFLAFAGLGVLSAHNARPSESCRPFDRSRSGFVMGEGAGAFVLESEASAERRGAAARGRVAGWGAAVSVHHVTASCPDGSAQASAMRRAMDCAGVDPGDIDYVNAHGTGTPDNDAAETRAIHLALGEYAHSIPVSSTKAATGHLIAAAGIVEAAVCLRAIQTGIVPPTLNLSHRDPECDLDYVPAKARAWNTRVAVSNSFGLGGSNVSLVMTG